MKGDFCTCLEDGGFDAGFSKLAAGVLAQEDVLPGRMERVQIAENLLREAIDDGTMDRIHDHARHLATLAIRPADPDDPYADWP